MRILFFLLFSLTANATTYYFSTSGNDSNNGTSPATPWKTIAKLNSFFPSLIPGDSIAFKRGETFKGTIVVTKSGPITITAYGIGSKPIITGLETLSSWSLVSGSVYECSSTAKNTVNMVTVNGVPQAVGRFPNSDAPNGGYLIYTFSGNTFTVPGLANWTGAEVISRKQGYVIERDKIISQSGSTITYAATKTINPRNGQASPIKPGGSGFGLFIQRDPRTLDKFGEWYFDTLRRKLQIYLPNPSSYTIKISVLDTLINIGKNSFITIDGLNLEGANLAAVYYQDNRNITIKNTSITYSGAKGTFGWNSANLTIDNCFFNYSMCSAIDHTSRHASNVSITNNIIKNTAMLPGMSSFYDDNDAKAIVVSVDSFLTIDNNKIDSCGYVGINYYGSNVNISNNYVNGFCFVKDDGAAIYTYAQTGYNRIVQGNIILNGPGNSDGNGFPKHAEGIYTDGGAGNIKILNNIIINVNNRGLYHNDPKNILDSGNTTYGCIGWSVNKHFSDSLFNLVIKNNSFLFWTIPVGNDQVYSNGGLNSTTRPVAGTIQSALQAIGEIDNNRYQFNSSTPFKWFYVQVGGGSYSFPAAVSFSSWQSFSQHDLHSKIIL